MPDIFSSIISVKPKFPIIEIVLRTFHCDCSIRGKLLKLRDQPADRPKFALSI